MKKWGFYLLSMTFFLIIVIILGFKMPESWTDCYSEPGICVSVVCILVLFIATIFYIYLHSVKSKGTLLVYLPFLRHFPIFLHFSPNLNFYLHIPQKTSYLCSAYKTILIFLEYINYKFIKVCTNL